MQMHIAVGYITNIECNGSAIGIQINIVINQVISYKKRCKNQ